VQILVDSGSTCSFVSADLASKLFGGQSLAVPPRVRIANGNIIECPQFFSDLSWEVQQCQFNSAFLALPMPSYDMILGMDWLASHRPMQIDSSRPDYGSLAREADGVTRGFSDPGDGLVS